MQRVLLEIDNVCQYFRTILTQLIEGVDLIVFAFMTDDPASEIPVSIFFQQKQPKKGEKGMRFSDTRCSCNDCGFHFREYIRMLGRVLKILQLLKHIEIAVSN